jgi:hypothetical protein
MSSQLRTAAFSLGLSAFLMTGSAFARIIISNGTGNEGGTCNYAQGSFCISDLRARAERSGQDNARWSCQASGGQPLTYTAYCSSSCFPNVINPGSSTWVSCNANCSMQCEVQNAM